MPKRKLTLTRLAAGYYRGPLPDGDTIEVVSTNQTSRAKWMVLRYPPTGSADVLTQEDTFGDALKWLSSGDRKVEVVDKRAPGGGRPRYDPDNPLVVRYPLRMSETDRTVFDRAADAAGQSLNLWLLEAARLAARQRAQAGPEATDG